VPTSLLAENDPVDVRKSVAGADQQIRQESGLAATIGCMTLRLLYLIF
jgi:hypothetical protein